MKNILKVIFLLLSLTVYSQTYITYQPTDEVLFNTERGFTKFTGTNSTNYSLLNLNTLNNYKNSQDKISLIYRGFYLPLNTIPQSYLNNMQTDFNTIRQSGLKVIVRFAYAETTNCGSNCQPTKAQILAHIQQLAPVLNNNIDVISTIQMGFIGGYGEWYYTNSSEFGHESYTNYTNQQWQNRKDIVDKLLNIVPNISIQLRYPYAKKKMYGEGYKDRIGYFNDAFLNTYGDEGFFPISQNAIPSQLQINEVIEQTSLNPMMGETNGVSNRTNGVNAIVEMDLYNWSAINKDYHTTVINSWINDGTYNEIRNRLGYRYEFKSSIWNLNNNILEYSIDIRNTGFANVFSKKKVYLKLNEYIYLLDIDLNNQESEFSIQGTINTENLPNGIYHAYLWIPDINLQDRSDYSIRIANLNVWENGLNRLNYSFEKTSLGIKENNTISYYPNPTNGNLYFPLEIEYKLYNINGQLLKRGFDNVIDLSDLSSSIYFIKIKNYNTIKIIKN